METARRSARALEFRKFASACCAALRFKPHVSATTCCRKHDGMDRICANDRKAWGSTCIACRLCRIHLYATQFLPYLAALGVAETGPHVRLERLCRFTLLSHAENILFRCQIWSCSRRQAECDPWWYVRRMKRFVGSHTFTRRF
jgi:hypothetical protein